MVADEPAAPDTPQEDGERQDTPPTPPEAEQPTPETGTPGEEEVNWQQRYENLQPEFTRVTQEAAELRAYQQAVEALHSEDPQLREQAAEALGLQLADEPAEPVEGEAEEVDPRFQEMWETHQAQQEQAYHQQQAAVAYEAIGEVLKADGREPRGPDDPATMLMFDRTFDLVMAGVDPGEAARSTVELVDQLRKAEVEQHQKSWADSKRTSTPVNGQEAVPTPSLDSHGDRVAHMVERLQANQQ